MKKRPDFSSNFLVSHEDSALHRHTIALAVIFTLVVGIVAALGARASYEAVQHGTDVLSEFGQLPVLSDIRRLVFGQASADASTGDGRMNILLLGIGGEGHDGPLLTDSMIYASIDLKNKAVGMVSIPRDLAYPLGNGQFEKINAINAYAEQASPGEGAKQTADAVAKLFDVRIDHVVRVDFSGFEEFINALGGLDINVENSFVDSSYPTDDLGPNPNQWVTVSFTKGLQHMDGHRVLTYVRSRHGSNGEGSDFARSRRQQIVLEAVRDKLLSLDTLTDPQKLADLYQAVAKHVETDLSPWDILKLAPLLKDYSSDCIHTRVLTDDPNGGELVAANVNGAFMLFPKKPDWSEIRGIFQNPFASPAEAAAANKPAPHTLVEIKNGTTRTGFAAQVAAKLEKSGYEITAFGNAVRRGEERTLLFDLTGGKKSAEFLRLKKLLDADVSTSLPAWITKDGNASSTRVVYSDGLAPERIFSVSTDFLVILGDSSSPLVDSPDSYAGQASS